MLKNQEIITVLLEKIKFGFQQGDRELLKSISTSPVLLASLMNTQTKQERQRIISNVLHFSIFIKLLFVMVWVAFIFIILGSKMTFQFHSLQDSLFRYGFLIVSIYLLSKNIRHIVYNQKLRKIIQLC